MFTKIVRKNTAQIINLRVDEKILHVTRRHVAILLLHLLIPLILLVISVALIFYRSIGGQILVTDATLSGQFTMLDRGIVFLLFASALIWLLTRRRMRDRRGARFSMLTFDSLLLILLVFRLMGGRLFVIQPYTPQTLDGFNFFLLACIALFVVLSIYIWIDWAADQLILTNQRIIINMERPWVWWIQEQLTIDDIQSVSAQTKTYLEHWMQLGTLKVKSASFAHVMIFSGARHPQEAQRQIMAEVNRTRKEEREPDFQRMVKNRVYNQEARASKPEPQIRRSYTPSVLCWLLGTNPEFHQETETYVWHPHWFFLVKSLLRPGSVLLISFLLLTSFLALDDIMGITTALLIGIILLGFLAWSVWEVEDHRNERYILTPAQIININKRPFGPELRQSAGLDALQNVTFKTTLIGRIIGYGDVVLETAGPGRSLTFYDIPNPREVVALINSYQQNFNKTRQERNLEDTLQLLQEYHTLYQQHQPGNEAVHAS